MTAQIKLRMLGMPTVVGDGSERAITSRRARQIVGVLALRHGKPTRGEVLSEILWPGDARETSASIRTYVARCRKQIAPIEVSNANGYELDVDVSDLDTTHFEHLVVEAHHRWSMSDLSAAAARYREALELWRGNPWLDLDDWETAAVDRIRLIEMRELARERVAGVELTAGHPDALIPEFEALHRAEPYREFRVELLMRAQTAAGRRGDALRSFRRFRLMLGDELGIAPSPALREIDSLIVRNETLPPLYDRAVRSVPRQEVGIDLVDLVGRDADLDLASSTVSARSEDAPVVNLRGRAGIGKTSLLRHLADRVGGSTFWVECYEAESSGSLRPAIMLLRQILGQFDDAQVADLLADGPELGFLVPEYALGTVDDDDGSNVPADRKFRIFDRITEVVRLAGAEHRCLVVVDDLHWADQLTVELFAHLCRHVGPNVAFVFGARDTEMATEAMPQGRHGATTLVLGPLSRAQTREVLSRHDVPLASEALRDQVLDLAAGNPFFAVELARDASERGETIGSHLPTPIATVLNRRIAPLDGDALELTKLIALAKGRVAHELLEECSGLDRESTVTAIEQACAADVVEQDWVDASVVYRLRHDLFRAAVVEPMPMSQRLLTHHRLARGADRLALEQRDRWVRTSAYHWHATGRAGSAERVIETNRRAGRLAYQACSYAEALVCFERALDGADWLGATTSSRAEILLDAANAAHRSADPDRRRQHAADAFAAARAMDLAGVAAEAALIHGGDRSTYGVKNDETTALLTEALEVADADDSNTVAALRSRLGQEVYHRDEFDLARNLTASALTPSSEPRTRARVLHGRVWTLNHPAFLSEREQLVAEMSDAARRSDDRELQLQALVWTAATALEVGRVVELDDAIERASALAGEVAVPSLTIRVATLRSCRALMSGDLLGAMTLAEEAHRLGVLSEPGNADQVLQAQLIGPMREMAQLRDLVGVLEAMADQYADTPGWECALAFALAEAGSHDAAREILTKHGQNEFDDVTPDLAWFRSMAYAAECAAIVGEASFAPALYDKLAPYTGRNVALWDIESGGSVDYYLGLLATLLADDDLAGRHLDAAIRFNTSTAQPHHRLRARLALADVRARSAHDAALGDEYGAIGAEADKLGLVALSVAASDRRHGQDGSTGSS